MRISDWSSDVCSSDLCPYHAWTYRADGSLSAVPSEKDFPHVDKEKNGLAPIHLDIWNGFIFLNFADTPEVSLREFLAGLDVMLDGAPFDQFPFYMQVTTEKIGRASVGKECVSTCRSRWSPYH